MAGLRYVVVGAGSVGGVIAGRLLEHGSQVLVVARGDNAEAIRANGLMLRSPDGAVTVEAPVATSASEAHLTTDDVLVFVTKTHQLSTALLEWVDQPVRDSDGEVVGTAGELLPALTALNGVEAERLAQRFFRRVYGVCIWLPGSRLMAGEFVVSIGPVSGVFIISRYGAGGDDGLLDAVHDEWEQASFHVHLVEDVMRWKYAKLIANLGNAIQALIGHDQDSELYRAVRKEGVAVLQAAGIDLASPEEEAAWRGDIFKGGREIPGVEQPMGGSSWQSLKRGSGDIETDYLNGEIVRVARSVGVPAPVNEGLQRLARQAAAERRAPGSFSADELSKLLSDVAG